MKLERPSNLGIAGIILSIIGLYLFLQINLQFSLTNVQIQWMPIIGGLVLGVGLAIIYKEKQLTTTLITFAGFLALAAFNWIAIGFAFGILIPGLIGSGKSLPYYLTAIVIFAVVLAAVSENPRPYQNALLDQITNMTLENSNGLTLGLENQVTNFLPSKDQVNQIMNSMMPCNNQTYQQQCIQLRTELANQLYAQIHSPETVQRIKQEIANQFKVDKPTLEATITQMPMMKELLNNIEYVVAFIEASIFLVYSIAISISVGITGFILGFIPEKKGEPGGI